MKFRLRKEKGRVAGRHIEKGKDGKDIVYEAGDTIYSEKELDKIFPGKFERIVIREDFADLGQPNIIDKRFKSPEDEKKALQKRLAELDANDVDSEDDDNDEDPPDNDDDASEDNDNEDESEPSEYGKDITDEFPAAVKVVAKVYIKDAWCVVIDPEADDPNNIMMTKKKIRKKDVEAFLEEYLDDDPEDDDPEDDDSEDDNDEE